MSRLQRCLSSAAFLVVTVPLGLVSAGLAGANDGWIDLLPDPDATTVISLRGTYRVVASVTMSDPNTDCIQIGASDVTLDLNGHTLQGPEEEWGGASGIKQTSGSRATVFNGTVRRFGYAGVQLELEGHVHHVRAMETGYFGILVLGRSLVEDNTLISNYYAAISARGSSVTVRRNVVVGVSGIPGYSLMLGNDTTPAQSTLVSDNSFGNAHDLHPEVMRNVYIYPTSDGTFERNRFTVYEGTLSYPINYTTLAGDGTFNGRLVLHSEPDPSGSVPTDNVL